MKFKQFLWLLLASLLFATGLASAQRTPQFGPPIKAIQDEEAQLFPLEKTTPPRELAEGAEVMLITGYEAKEEGQHGSMINVEIDRPNSKVLLILTSYQQLFWKVTATPGTTVSGILIAASSRPPTLSSPLETRAYQVKLPDAYEIDSRDFKSTLAQLNEWFGVSKLDAFVGAYRLPSSIRISTLEPNRPELTRQGFAPEKPVKNFTFPLITADYKRMQWRLTGPKGAPETPLANLEKVALSPSGKELYQTKNHGFNIINLATEAQVMVPLPANFPRFSWPSGIAYDTKRNLVTLVTFGGEGFLYRLDAINKKWLDTRSLNNEDIFSLTYDASADRYVGWTSNGELILISGDGEFLFKKRIVEKLPEFGVYGRSSGFGSPVALAAQGDNIALIQSAEGEIKVIWNYRLDTDEARLTYKKASGGKGG